MDSTSMDSTVPGTAAPVEAANGQYDPNHLLNTVSESLEVQNDAELASALEIPRPLLGKIRLGKQRVGATILLRMQELSGIPIRRLRAILGERRAAFRVGQH